MAFSLGLTSIYCEQTQTTPLLKFLRTSTITQLKGSYLRKAKNLNQSELVNKVTRWGSIPLAGTASYNEWKEEGFMSSTIMGVVTNGVVVPNTPLPEGRKSKST